MRLSRTRGERQNEKCSFRLIACEILWDVLLDHLIYLWQPKCSCSLFLGHKAICLVVRWRVPIIWNLIKETVNTRMILDHGAINSYILTCSLTYVPSCEGSPPPISSFPTVLVSWIPLNISRCNRLSYLCNTLWSVSRSVPLPPPPKARSPSFTPPPLCGAFSFLG